MLEQFEDELRNTVLDDLFLNERVHGKGRAVPFCHELEAVGPLHLEELKVGVPQPAHAAGLTIPEDDVPLN